MFSRNRKTNISVNIYLYLKSENNIYYPVPTESFNASKSRAGNTSKQGYKS